VSLTTVGTQVQESSGDEKDGVILGDDVYSSDSRSTTIKAEPPRLRRRRRRTRDSSTKPRQTRSSVKNSSTNNRARGALPTGNSPSNHSRSSISSPTTPPPTSSPLNSSSPRILNSSPNFYCLDSDVDNWDYENEENRILVRPPSSITDFNLRQSSVISENDATNILRSCPSLTTLNLGMAPCLSLEVIRVLATSKCASTLTELHINNSPYISDPAVELIAANCKQLKHLFLDMCEGVTDLGILAIGESLHSLLSLGLCANQITDRSLLALSAGCIKLEKLELSFCHQLTALGIQTLAEHCPNLTNLNACLVDQIDDDAISALALNCNLTEINLRSCLLITDVSMKSLATHCPRV